MAEYNPSKIIKDGNTYNFRDNTKIPLAGSNQISGDLIPSTNGTVNFGSSSYQWNNAYIKSLTINGVACGDILTHNASEFVDVSSNQTIGGQKTWTDRQKYAGNNARGVLSIYNSSYTKGSEVSDTDLSIGTIFLGDGGNTGLANSLGFISCDLAATGNISRLFLSAIKNEASSGERANLVIEYDKSDITSPEKIRCKGTVLPSSDNAYSLGTSTNKWKSFNGINPGALSLPNVNNDVVAVDTTNFAWNTNWIYTPVFDGWITVEVPASSATKRRYSVSQASLRYWYPNQNGEIFRFSFPVVKGISVYFAFTSDINEPAAPTIKLLKAQGNV